MNKAAIKRAIRVLKRHAQERFDACSDSEGNGFACGTCPCGNSICAKEHAEIVRSAKEISSLLRDGDNRA